ncbi:MAG: PIN domain-containing protein [Dehalococcoidia bacterium]|nr:PIN domain-containing protein [Dehalococcoidia bacterium]MDZ4278339.1 PIN domain-containing protein [Dehalococcoidia bacterium]
MCFDTNALIYFLNRIQPYAGFVEGLLRGVRDGTRYAVVSVVTELELVVQPIRLGLIPEVERVEALLRAPGFQVAPLDRVTAKSAAEVRARHGIELADATIVATSLHMDCDFIIGNDRRCARRIREIPYVLLDQLVKEQSS